MIDIKRLSILIAGVDCFIGDSARGILNPVLWPLAQKCGASVTELGLLVSTFSIGRVVISTEIGRYADESAGRHRGALLLSGMILIVGIALWSNVLYAGGLPTLFVAQFLMGLGTGNLGVLRSYVAEQALPQERTWQLARLSALQYAGFAATPIIGACLFVAGSSFGGDFKYSFPAYLITFCAVAIQAFLWYPFKNLDDVEATAIIRKSVALNKAPPEVIAAVSGTKSRPLSTASTVIAGGTCEERAFSDLDIDPEEQKRQVSIIDLNDADVEAVKRSRRARNTMSLRLNEIVVDDFDGDGDEDPVEENNHQLFRRFSNRSSTSRSSSFAADGDIRNTATKAISTGIFMMSPMHSAPVSDPPSNQRVSTDIDKKEKGKEDEPAPPQIIFEKDANKPENNNNDSNNGGIVGKIRQWLAETFFYESNEENDLKTVYTLFIFLNFTTRGVVAIYESIGTALLLDQYRLTELQVGGLVSLTGSVGTINLILFKEFWTKNFDDMTLMNGGLLVTLFAQLFIINYGKDQSHPLWEYALSLALVYSVGYPIGNSAVLGMFSILSKKGKQGKAQGQFALMGSVARILMPVVAGFSNEFLDPLASFGIACMLMSISLFGIVYLYHRIMFFRYGNPFNPNNKLANGEASSPDDIVMSDHDYRNQPLVPWQYVCMFVSFLFGLFGFLTSVDFFNPNW